MSKPFVLKKAFKFEASHVLPHHDGKCARLHGHSWVGRVVVEGDINMLPGPKRGMVIDYNDLKVLVTDMVDRYLDHHHLNETLLPFGVEVPTSEAIARWCYVWLKPNLPSLVAVEINETCTSSCTYRPQVRNPREGQADTGGTTPPRSGTVEGRD